MAVIEVAVTVPLAFASPWTTTLSPGWTSVASVEAVRSTFAVDFTRTLIVLPSASLT